MAPRVRVVLTVAVAAVAAAGATVAVAWVTTDRPSSPKPKLRAGVPPLAFDLRGRTDPAATILRRAEALYDAGRRSEASLLFARSHSLGASVGVALSDWPSGSVGRLQSLGRAHPRSGLVQLHLGLALLWEGRTREAERALRAASARDPDSFYAVRADNLLFPNFAPGLPRFVPSFDAPRRITRLAPIAQLRALRRAASGSDARARILYGVALQTLDRPVSAEQEFTSAAALAPGSVDARVAAAVGRFRKSDPSRAFSRLGPLVRTFPHEPSVRFHLGLLLLWIDQVPQARKELALARSEVPSSRLSMEAGRLLARL